MMSCPELCPTVARSAYWADGSLLVDLDDTVIRERLAPNLLSALSCTAAAPARLGIDKDPMIRRGPRGGAAVARFAVRQPQPTQVLHRHPLQAVIA